MASRWDDVAEGEHATPASINDRLDAFRKGDVYNVKRFGATGDGTTDDTSSIQSAIDACNAAGGGTVFAPPGTYSITSIIVPGNNITLRGAGSHFAYSSNLRASTIFKARSGASTNLISLTTTDTIAGPTGCRLADFSVDGNLLATYGIRANNAHVMERVHAKSCLSAGIRLANLTNSVRIVNSAMNNNFYYGLQIDGPASTPVSVVGSNIQLNGVGGVYMSGGNSVVFDTTVIESNASVGVHIQREAGNANLFQSIDFRSVWLEDNPLGVFIDAASQSEANAPSRIRFDRCNISVSSQSIYANIQCGKWVTFDSCRLSNSSHTNAFTLGTHAYQVAVLESNATQLEMGGLNTAQLDSIASSGNRCYWSDRQTRRTVATYNNSWVADPSVKYWFDEQGNVCLGGGMRSGSGSVSAFTLPPGYRPAVTRRFVVPSGVTPTSISVWTTGAVMMDAGSAASVSLDGLKFPTD
jgi:hypothetical protein